MDQLIRNGTLAHVLVPSAQPRTWISGIFLMYPRNTLLDRASNAFVYMLQTCFVVDRSACKVRTYPMLPMVPAYSVPVQKCKYIDMTVARQEKGNKVNKWLQWSDRHHRYHPYVDFSDDRDTPTESCALSDNIFACSTAKLINPEQCWSFILLRTYWQSHSFFLQEFRLHEVADARST